VTPRELLGRYDPVSLPRAPVVFDAAAWRLLGIRDVPA
jgi:hypothetical protein